MALGVGVMSYIDIILKITHLYDIMKISTLKSTIEFNIIASQARLLLFFI